MKLDRPTLDIAALSKEITAVSSTGAPPVDRWNPDYCGEIDLRIKRDGTWLYGGTPIGRPALVKLFSSVLWQENGQYFLKTPVEKMAIQVDDVPFHIVHLDVFNQEGSAVLRFVTQTGDEIVAGNEHPIRVVQDPITGEPSPYLLIRFGMEGLISRSVFYQLVELAQCEREAGRERWWIESQGARFVLSESALSE